MNAHGREPVIDWPDQKKQKKKEEPERLFLEEREMLHLPHGGLRIVKYLCESLRLARVVSTLGSFQGGGGG